MQNAFFSIYCNQHADI